MEDESSGAPEPGSANYATDFAAFSQVVSALQQLDEPGRVRLLKTVATFFNIGADRFLSTREPSRPSSAIGGLPPATPAAFSEDRAPSPKDFLRDKRPKTDVERIVCLAYYLTHYRNTPYFKTVDLSKLNTEAAQVKFSNAAYATDNAAKAGLLVPAAKGAKQISAHGEEYVQALPDRAAAKEVLANRPRRRKRSNAGASDAAPEEGEE